MAWNLICACYSSDPHQSICTCRAIISYRQVKALDDQWRFNDIRISEGLLYTYAILNPLLQVLWLQSSPKMRYRAPQGGLCRTGRKKRGGRRDKTASYQSTCTASPWWFLPAGVEMRDCSGGPVTPALWLARGGTRASTHSSDLLGISFSSC